MTAIEVFVRQVLDDRALQDELCALGERESFIARVVSIAAARGLVLEPDDLRARMQAGFRGWLERWVS